MANVTDATMSTFSVAFSTTPKETSLLKTCNQALSLAVATQVAVYCLVALGIVLNTAVSILMLRNKVVGKNMSNFFIFHLSVVDLVFRVIVVAPLLYMTVGSSVENVTIACKGYVFVSAMCGCATFVSLAAIAMDVYKESSNTLRGVMSIRLPILLTLAVWLYAALSSAPVLYSSTSLVYTDVAEAQGTESLKHMNCSLPKICDFKQGWSGKLSTTLYLVLAVFIPFTIIFVLHVKTTFNLDQRSRNKTIDHVVALSKSKITRMLIMLGLGALISWGPAAVVSLLRSYQVLCGLDFDVVLVIAKTVEVMQFLNSVMNPFIFACFISNFRRDYFGLCCRQEEEQVGIQNIVKTLASTELDSKTVYA